VQDLHHSDIITYALTHLAGQYAREKQEILRDLRNYRATQKGAASVQLGGQDLSRLPAATSAAGRDMTPPKPSHYL
jgi:hypothetical protein